MTTLEEAIAYGRGAERSFNCHAHDDKNASASVNVDKGLWYCYTCGARGRVGEATELADYSNFHRKISRVIQEPPSPYPESWLDLFDAGPVHPYWLSRFEEETCRYFRLGYDASVGKPCYPIRYPDGQIAGLVHRSIDGEQPKYKYPWGIDIGKMLYNYRPHKVEHLWLVEGATDAMALHESGYKAFGIFGSKLKQAQIDLIVKCDPDKVVLAFDMDLAGRTAIREASVTLSARGLKIGVASWDRNLGKDPGELEVIDRHKILVKDILR